MSVPCPLYTEFKYYIEDLLNRGWTTKSHSPYSALVVCVRKKDRGLRLCIDYRELNRKTMPDRHPIQRIQKTLENLGGNLWFSSLDQGKAYHQGFIDKGSRHYFLSSRHGVYMSGFVSHLYSLMLQPSSSVMWRIAYRGFEMRYVYPTCTLLLCIAKRLRNMCRIYEQC